MQPIWVGTSGYNYPEWKGSFYPQKLPASKMLPYYAERLATVEINYTFYRTPNEKILSGWDRETPQNFKLTLKAPKRITHIARLKGCADLTQYFLKTAATLGPKLGAILFQLPPYLRKDLAALDEFLPLLPPGTCAAFEFRHASWMDAEVFARLRAHDLALCIADSEKFSTPLEITASYGYFRLRDEGYTPETSSAGPGSSAPAPPPAARCSSTSSTKKPARDRSSRACCWTHWRTLRPSCAPGATPVAVRQPGPKRSFFPPLHPKRLPCASSLKTVTVTSRGFRHAPFRTLRRRHRHVRLSRHCRRGRHRRRLQEAPDRTGTAARGH